MNNSGAARVISTKRPRAVKVRVPVRQSLKMFSDRDSTLVEMGDAAKGGSWKKFDKGSKSKADNDDFDMLVGSRFARAREMAQMSLESAAEALKISKQTLYKYESGERTLKAKTLYDAVKLYGVDAGWLLCLTDDLKVTRTDDKGRTVTVTYKGVGAASEDKDKEDEE